VAIGRVPDKLNMLSKHEYVSPVWRAKIYAGLKDKDVVSDPIGAVAHLGLARAYALILIQAKREYAKLR